MSPNPTDAELRELLGAYAIGALDAAERDAVERFLLRDADARSEVHALQLGAAWVAASAPRPSEAVWERIAAEVDHDLGRTRTTPSIHWISRLREPRQRLLAAAAVVLVLVGAAFGVTELVGNGTTTTRDVALAQAVRAAQHDPKSRVVDLVAPNGQGSAHVVVLPTGRGYVVSAALPQIDADQTYQLWSLTSDGPVSAGVLGRRPGVHAFHFPRTTSSLAITTEPAGGSRTPHGLPVALAPLPTF